MQAQAQGQTKPNTLTLSPGADAASVAGISSLNDLYKTKLILLRGVKENISWTSVNFYGFG